MKFACPACQARLRVAEDLAARKVRCRACEKVVIAPLEGDDPDIKIVEREADPAALQALIAKDAHGGAGRKIAIGVGIGVVVLSVLFVAWVFLNPGGSLPEIVTELPEGDFWIYRTAEGSGFFREEKVDFEGAKDWVTVYRGRERMEPLTIYRGDFKVAEITKGLADRGYSEETLEGEKIFLYPRSGDAVWVHRNRIFSGTREYVIEAIRVRKGRSKPFTAADESQKRTTEQLPRGDVMYFGRAPSAAERAFVANWSRGLLEHVTPGRGGIGVSLKLQTREQATVVASIGYSDRREETGARESLERLREYIDVLDVATRNRAVVAQGTLRVETLTWRANEAEAVRALRKLAVAEADFRENDRDRNGVKDFWTGDVSCLHRLHVDGVAIDVIDRELAAADHRPRPPGDESGRVGVQLLRQAWRGYWFSALEVDGAGGSYLVDTDGNESRVHHLSAFAICATPDSRGSGQYTILINEQGHLWRKDTGGEPVRSWPADPEKEGWSKVWQP